MRRISPLRLVTPLAASAAILVPASAFAQGTPASPEATPPSSAAPATAAPAPAAATPSLAAVPPAHPTLTDEEADANGRLWIGFNVGGGVGTGASLSGPAFDGQFRAGYVLNHLYGVYGNVTGIAWVAGGGSSNAGGASVSVGAVSGFLVTPMFALTPVDLFEVSVGPSLDVLGGGKASVSSSTSAGSASAGGFSGAYFGAEGRVALHLGGRNPETHRRRGFTLSLDVHPSFVSGGPITFITGGLGADWF